MLMTAANKINNIFHLQSTEIFINYQKKNPLIIKQRSQDHGTSSLKRSIMTIHNAPLGAGGVGCLYVIFFLCIEEEVMSLSVFYYCTCIYVLFYVSHCCYLSFNPSLFCLSPFLLSYVAVSRPCGLWEFYCNRTSQWQ